MEIGLYEVLSLVEVESGIYTRMAEGRYSCDWLR